MSLLVSRAGELELSFLKIDELRKWCALLEDGIAVRKATFTQKIEQFDDGWGTEEHLL
jgi:uncharacterized small protein (DUF1192 family)